MSKKEARNAATFRANLVIITIGIATVILIHRFTK